MDTVQLNIKNIKNIRNAKLELPFRGGVYAIAGANGCGKSTIMLILSVLLSKKRYSMFQCEDISSDSFIEIKITDSSLKTPYRKCKWVVDNEKLTLIEPNKPIIYTGMYEGSLFYGARFENSTIVDELLKKKSILNEDITKAPEEISKTLSYILRGDQNNYQSLSKIASLKIARKYKLDNVPYFVEAHNGNLLSQYRMSSGECLLISLLNYIYFTLRQKEETQRKKIIIIDEVELAFHPIAIERFMEYLHDLVEEHPNFIIYITSHSPKVINYVHPSKLYMLENNQGDISYINPCYPSYAIRELYKNDGYDVIILVEDELARLVIDKIVLEENLIKSRLINIIPVGGWRNVLTLHKDILEKRLFSEKCKVISILDGDVRNEKVPKGTKELPKIYLPINSVEKFLYSIVLKNQNLDFKKVINDKYCRVLSLRQIIDEFNGKNRSTEDIEKKFYHFFIEKIQMTEDSFVRELTKDIFDTDFINDSFLNSFKSFLSK